MKCKIIAEIGCNHGGDIALAKRMIKAAANAGADFVKFQTWQVKNLKPGPWMFDGRYELYMKAELSREQHYELFDYCKQMNVRFLTSIFNIEDIGWLSELLDIIKIPSPEAANKDLLLAVNKYFNNIILSTGATTSQEIRNIAYLVPLQKITALHCVSQYPCAAENVNLPRIDSLKANFSSVGYSSHFFGIADALAALHKKINYLEKHFTIDRSLPGRDNQFAILPQELKMISEYRDHLDIFNIDKGLDMQTCELDAYHNYRGRWS